MTLHRRILGALLLVLSWVLLAHTLPAIADTAPDATAVGPLATTSAEYRLPATIDPDILSDRFTEIWARVYMPVDLSGGPHPLLIFLHGNHNTCGHGSNPRIDDSSQYTTSGTCPPGYVITPNHLGYSYLADRLASWGYIVVSINANRGITAGAGITGDSGLNLARGRLILKHLQRLSEWNTLGGTPTSLGVDLMGQLDFSSIGLMGHSRGGEGVRAAYNLYRDAGSLWPTRIPEPVTFRSLFEIAPVDGQTSRVLNADGTVWNVLLPMCDGDVSDLEGVKPLDRMLRISAESLPTQKSNFTVWGANHNFYNTEWQLTDSGGCGGAGNFMLWQAGAIGSAPQRQTALASVMALFRGNVGNEFFPANALFNQIFNPQYNLPSVVTSVTRVDRGFTDSPNMGITTVFEDFTRATGTSSYGVPNNASGITIVHGTVPNHDAGQRAGVISWTAGGDNTFFQTNWTPVGSGIDISNYQTLHLRISRQNSTLNPSLSPTDCSLSLAMADGTTYSQKLALSAYTDLRGPVGGPGTNLHPILQTVRIPLADFGGADLTQVRGVQVTFDRSTTGAIYLANIRLSVLGPSPSLNDLTFVGNGPPMQEEDPVVINNPGKIQSIRALPSAPALEGKPGIDIEVTSDVPFPVRDALAVLCIGAHKFDLSRYPDSGDPHTLIFTLTDREFAQTVPGAEVTVQYGKGASDVLWTFGPLDKSLLHR